MPAPYRPVACALYDRLEALALRGTPAALAWRDADGRLHRADDAVVADVFAEGEADWLRLRRPGRPDAVVRLDVLVSVDGHAAGAC